MSTVKENKKFQFFVITLITLASVLGITSVPPAFPAIAEHFNLPIDKIGILMGVFTMPGIILTPIFGYLADKYSRHTILIPALIIFALAGFACTFAESFQTLVILRFIEGIGVAPLGALNVSLIGDVFDKKDTSRFTGYNNTVLSIGTASFPLLGGFLTAISWNTVFYLPLFTILVAILFTIAFKTKHVSNTSISFRNLLDSFKISDFRKISIMNFLSYILLIGCLFTYIPFHFKYQFGLTSKDTGLYLFVMSFSAAISSFFLYKVIDLISEKGIMIVKFFLFSVVFISLPLLTKEMIFPALALFGFAFGMGFPGLQYWILNISNDSNRASMISTHRAVSQIGQTVGPIVIGYYAANFAQPNSVVEIFELGAIISVFTLLISIFMLKKYIYNNIKEF